MEMLVMEKGELCEIETRQEVSTPTTINNPTVGVKWRLLLAASMLCSPFCEHSLRTRSLVSIPAHPPLSLFSGDHNAASFRNARNLTRISLLQVTTSP
jgi:hypothetical protein